MKRKETASGSGEGEDVVPKWSTYEDMPRKRLGVEDTSSINSDSEGLGDEVCTLCRLCYAATLKEDRAHNCGEKIGIE
jgi:hypothetical protein